MSILINKIILTSSKVGIVSPRNQKSIKFKNYYYEFPNNSSEYSLELAFSQIEQLNNFDVVVAPNNNGTMYYFFFNSNQLRKTLLVDNSYFLVQLTKFKELFSSIVILNDTRLVGEGIYQDNPEIFENVSFLAIEKLPDLIDSRKRALLIKKYISLIVLSIFIIIGLNFYENSLNVNIESLEMESKKKDLLLVSIMGKRESLIKVELPSKEQQVIELNNVFKQIEEGGIK